MYTIAFMEFKENISDVIYILEVKDILDHQ